MEFPIKDGDLNHSYVELPEGMLNRYAELLEDIASRKVVPQFVNAKLVNISSTSLGFMEVISI